MRIDKIQDQTSKNGKIVSILRNWSVLIGLVAIFVGLILSIVTNKIPFNEFVWINFLQSISFVFSTGGTTFLSVALINFIYEQWRDNDMENKVNDIPESVKKNIESSITQISANITCRFNPCVPCKIFPPGLQQNDPIADYIRKSIENSDGKYYYTGIGMSTMASVIGEITDKLKEAYFLIPHPKCEGLTDDDRSIMVNSIEEIIEAWESAKQIKVEFVLLNYIPPFHIHKTSTDCWFAFLDKRAHDNQERQKYPATYQYQKNKDKSDDSYEMYHTIADTIDKLYSRHLAGALSERYIFMQGQSVWTTRMNRPINRTVDITYQKYDTSIVAIKKEDFTNIFTAVENHE